VAAGDGGLAEAVHGAVRPDARVVRHPAQDEWTAWRRETVAPILRLARVRSWTAFLASALRAAPEAAERTDTPHLSRRRL
jgi:hypothetical protein